MPARKKKPAEKVVWKLGDRVRIRHTGWTGPIVEVRGPLGGNGTQVYSVEITLGPDPAHVEVREDQLIHVPPEPQPQSD
jgi:hypothetical protein